MIACVFVQASVMFWGAGAAFAQEPVPREAATAAADESSSVADRTAALEEAVARAEAAADQATYALRALDEAERKRRRRFERPGPYLGAAFFYAAENFEDRIIVESSLGGAAFVGYRFAAPFAVELRYEGFNGFDLHGRLGHGEIDGSALTLSAKAYPFKGAIQPFAGVGIGAIFAEQRSVFDDGSRSRSSDEDGAFRFAAGLDLWLTEFLVLNFEASYLVPIDDLSNLEMTILSTGLTFRY